MIGAVSKDDKSVTIRFRLYTLSNWRPIKLKDGDRIKHYSTAFAIGFFVLLVWFIISYLSFNPAKSVKEVMLF